MRAKKKKKPFVNYFRRANGLRANGRRPTSIFADSSSRVRVYNEANVRSYALLLLYIMSVRRPDHDDKGYNRIVPVLGSGQSTLVQLRHRRA